MPFRRCKTPRCANAATYRGRCAQCNAARNAQTHRNRSIYNSKRWKVLRRRVLWEQPLCAHDGCEAIATDVHHKQALEDRPDLAFVRSNLEGLCHAHHSSRTATELRTR